jgi:hypothetical protein
MRRHLRTTELTIQQIKQSTCERIFRRDAQILERFAEKLRALNGFTQEMPLLPDAFLELCNIRVPNDIVQNVLTAVLVLFGREIKQEWVCNYKNKCALVYIAESHMSDPPSVQIEIFEWLLNNIVRSCIYLTTYNWIKSFLKITIEGRDLYGNLENKINTLYWPVENSIPTNNDQFDFDAVRNKVCRVYLTRLIIYMCVYFDLA